MADYREGINVSGGRLAGSPVLAVRNSAATDRSGGVDGGLASLQVDAVGNLKVVFGGNDASQSEINEPVSPVGAPVSAGFLRRGDDRLELQRGYSPRTTATVATGANAAVDLTNNQLMPIMLLMMARLVYERSKWSGIDLFKLTARDLFAGGM